MGGIREIKLYEGVLGSLSRAHSGSESLRRGLEPF